MIPCRPTLEAKITPSMSSNSEKTLILKIQGKDPEVFERLLRSFGPRLLRAAFCMSGDQTDAEDLIQETFMRAFNSAERFQGKSAVYTWLYGIMRNVHLDRLRKKMKTPKHANVEDVEVVDKRKFREDTKVEVIRHEMNQLDRSTAEVIKMRYFDKLSVEEIAEKLGVASGTVKSRLFHARNKLKEKKNLMDLMGL